MQTIRHEIGRYLLTGAVVTIVGTLLLASLLHFLAYPIAYTLVFVASVTANILLHSRFVFRTRLGKAGKLQAVLVQVIQYCIGLAGLAFFIHVAELGPTLSPFANLALCTPINFVLSRFVFKKAGNDAHVATFR